MTVRIKAAILRKTGEPLSVENITHTPLQFGQLLVRIIYSGICRSQLMEQQGERGIDKWLPHLLGHEGLGEVLEIGIGVTKCKVGDKVVISWIQGTGIEADNPTYLDDAGLRINSGKATTFSTHSVVSENQIFLAPEGFPDHILPLFGCALLTGGGIALKYGMVSENANICILGFGGIGTAAALVLRGMKIKNLDVVDQAQKKRVLAKKLGFFNTFPSIEKADRKYDLVIESTGSIEGIQSGFDGLNDSGVIVFASHPGEGMRISLNPHELIKGKRIFGTWGGDVEPDTDIHRIAKFLLASGLDLELLIGEIFSIDEVNDALAYLDSGKPGRPLLEINGDLK
jgi:S-(hydroxymethyl)glutathione dehydrogenase / alcohol dehydrogenase